MPFQPRYNPHGTVERYRQRCRCDKCRAAKAKQHRERELIKPRVRPPVEHILEQRGNVVPLPVAYIRYYKWLRLNGVSRPEAKLRTQRFWKRMHTGLFSGVTNEDLHD